MWFRSFRRGLSYPVRKRLARTFATRSELEASSAKLEALSAKLEESSDQIDALVARLANTDRRADEVRRSIGQIQEQIAQIAGGLSSLTNTVAQVGPALGRFEASEQFTRQAVDHIASRLFGGLENTGEGQSAVGVVVATCDRPHALRRALTSIAAQSRRPEAVVVVDDGREDAGDVVREFAHRLSISALKTASPHSGSSAARNLALDALRTDLVAFLDDDNLMWPRWIEQAGAFLDADPKIDVVYGAQLRDEELSSTRKNWFLEPFDLSRLQKGNYIDLNQVLHRKSAARFDQNLRRFVDWDYLLRLIGDKADAVVPVDAISSLYSTVEPNRVTVAHWPPELFESIASRNHGRRLPVPPNTRVCSCCGFAGAFQPGPRQRPNASCPQCGSLERHRFLQLVGPLLRAFWLPETRPAARATMIEIAPSHATAPFRNLFGLTTTVDASPEADGRDVDVVASLTALPMPSDYADVLLALHVLEHIPEDRKAMSEIARVLAPTGAAVLQVPLSGLEATDEEELAIPRERVARYGQADHVRLYGKDLFARLAEAGLASVAVSPRESLLPETIAKFGLLPDEGLIFAVRSDAQRAGARLVAFASSLRKGSDIVRPPTAERPEGA